MAYVDWTRLGKALKFTSYMISAYVIGAFWLGHRSYNSARWELDTNYLRWTTRLPAVSVCQAADFNSLSLNLSNQDEIKFIHGLVRPKNTMCKRCKKVSSRFKSADLGQIILKVAANCEDIFHNCSFNGNEFNCCQKFSKLQTKKGICYSVNSEMTKFNVRFLVSHFAKDAALFFSVNFPVQVFVHDPKEVLFLNRRAPIVQPGIGLTLLYRTTNTVVDESARDLTTHQRGCVVEEERSVRGHRVYSRSSCQSECLARTQQTLCGCHHHLLLPQENSSICDIDGLQCLDYNSKIIRANSKSFSGCDCLPSCDQQEVKVVWGQLKKEKSPATIKIQLMSPPTERLVLKSRIEFLDALVGFACFTRIFTNISILEIINLVIIQFYPSRAHQSYRDILY